MQTALLLINFQNIFFKGGKQAVKGAKSCAKTAADVLAHFREQGLPVYHCLHQPQAELLDGTENSGIWEKLAPLAAEETLIGTEASVFEETPLHEKLQQKGVERLVICCINTDNQLDASIRDAKALGYHNICLQDGCVTGKLNFDGHKLKADTVLMVLLASLNGTYTEVCTGKDFIKAEEKKRKKLSRQPKKEPKAPAKAVAVH